MRHRWAYLPEQVHAEGGDLPGRDRAVSSRTVQQHFGPQGELPGLLRLCAARRTGLRKRRKRLQVHVSDETAHLRVSLSAFERIRFVPRPSTQRVVRHDARHLPRDFPSFDRFTRETRSIAG